MATMIETLAAQLGGSSVQNLARSVGADQAATQKALGAALPFLVSALAKNAASPQGAEALHRALARDHDGSVLQDLTASLTRPNVAAGDGILRHALGDRRQAVEAGIGKASGLDPSAVASMMTTLAPVVMGMLGRTQRQQGLDASGLARMLQGEQQHAAAPALGGLAKLLDTDGDGQVMDDLAKLGGGLLSGLLGKRKV